MTATPETANRDGTVDRIKLLSARDQQGVPAMKPVAVIVLAAIILGSAGCSKPTPNAAAQPPPVANDPLQAAFAVAFPSGATEKNDSGDTLTYTAKKLVPVASDGSVQALISEGSQGDDAGHIALGSLRITYLNSSGDTFNRPQPRVQETLGGNGFGQPPDWEVIQLHHKPALRVKYTYSNQGCTDTTVEVYVFDTSGIDLDRRASKPMKEACEDQPSAESDSNTDAAADGAAGAGASTESNTTSATTTTDPGAHQ